MKIQQVSVFLENKPGRLSEPCQILAEAGINILTLSLADTQQFGILRLVVRDWEKAKEALERVTVMLQVPNGADALHALSQARETRMLPPGIAPDTCFTLVEIAEGMRRHVEGMA